MTSLYLNAVASGILLGAFYAAVTLGIAISFGMLDVVIGMNSQKLRCIFPVSGLAALVDLSPELGGQTFEFLKPTGFLTGL